MTTARRMGFTTASAPKRATATQAAASTPAGAAASTVRQAAPAANAANHAMAFARW